MVNPAPAILFRVNLELNASEQIGPNTNAKDTGVLHPDRFVGLGTICGPGATADDPLPGSALANLAQRKYTRSACLEQDKKYTVINGEFSPTLNFKHGDLVMLYGQKALEARQKYAAGAWNSNTPTAGLGAILTVVS